MVVSSSGIPTKQFYPKVPIDQVNDFVVSNFTPYSWSHLWETTEPDSKGVYKFIMSIRPNLVESKFAYGGKTYIVSSSSSGELPPPEYYSCYALEIPMIRGSSIVKGGIQLDEDPKLKYTYISHLKKSIWFSIEKLYGIAQPVTTEEDLFGRSFSRVKDWLDGSPRKDWAFILS